MFTISSIVPIVNLFIRNSALCFSRFGGKLVPKQSTYISLQLCFNIVDRTNWFGNLTVSLLYVFVLYFLCSLALTVHKTQKVLKCK